MIDKIKELAKNFDSLSPSQRQAVITAYRLGERKPLTAIRESPEGESLFTYREETPNGLIITERNAMGITTIKHRSLHCCGHYSWASCEPSYSKEYFLNRWRTNSIRIIRCNI